MNILPHFIGFYDNSCFPCTFSSETNELCECLQALIIKPPCCSTFQKETGKGSFYGNSMNYMFLQFSNVHIYKLNFIWLSKPKYCFDHFLYKNGTNNSMYFDTKVSIHKHIHSWLKCERRSTLTITQQSCFGFFVNNFMKQWSSTAGNKGQCTSGTSTNVSFLCTPTLQISVQSSYNTSHTP